MRVSVESHGSLHPLRLIAVMRYTCGGEFETTKYGTFQSRLNCKLLLMNTSAKWANVSVNNIQYTAYFSHSKEIAHANRTSNAK